MYRTMWIRTSDGQIINTAWVRRIYAEDEDGENKVTAEMNDGGFESLRLCETMKAARDNVNYIHRCLSEDVKVCNLYSDKK